MKTKSVDAMDHGELILLFIAINQANEKNRSIAAFCQRESIDLRTLYHDAASDRNEKNSVFPNSSCEGCGTVRVRRKSIQLKG